MDSEVIYNLLITIIDYLMPKEKENAMSVILKDLYDNDVDINELLELAENDDEQFLAKQIKSFIKDNGLEDEEEDEEEW